MAAAARTVSVIVEGDSKPLQVALSEATKSLDAFASRLARTGGQAAGEADAIAGSAAKIAESYGTLSASVAGSLGKLTASLAGQAQAIAGMVADTEAGTTRIAETWASSNQRIVGEYEFFRGRMNALQLDANAKMVAEQQTMGEQTLAVQREQHAALLEDQAAYLERASAEQAAAQRRMMSTIGGSDARMVAAQDALYNREAKASEAAASASTRSSGIIQANNARAAKSFGDTGTALVTWGKRASLGVVGIGAASLYMSGKFEQAALRLHTQAGASLSELKKLEAGVLDLGLKGGMGQTPKQLEEGLYHVVSSMDKVLPAGTRVNEMLHIMKVAAMGAAVGGTSMQETSYALASAMNALHEHGGDAYKTMGELNAIVGSGDMTMQDLLAAMKSGVVPTADQFGVSLRSLGAAMAVMGDMGMRGAQAGTRLRMSLALLGGPSKQAADILTTLGMTSKEVATHNKAMAEALDKAGLHMTSLAEDLHKPNGIAFALQDLRDHLMKAGLSSEAAAGVMVRAFGGGRMAATIDLLSQNVDRLKIKYGQIGDESTKFNSDYQKASETLSFKAKEALATVEALGIKIGHFLTPAAKDAVDSLKNMAEWLEHNETAMKVLASVTLVGLGTAITAYGVNRFRALSSSMAEAASHMTKGFLFGGPSSAENAAGAGGGFAGRLTPGQIAGARGLSLPGSIANPIVVAIESGQYAGLGGMGAAGTAQTEAQMAAKKATGEVTSAPVGVAGAASDVPAAEAGFMASMKGGIEKVLGNTMKAGLVGIGGIITTELVSHAVGGSAGKTISGVGNDAAIGAAVGTAIEPGIGTAIGAGFGGVVGAIKQITAGAPEGPESAAADLAHPKHGPNLGKKFEAEASKTLKALEKLRDEAIGEGEGEGSEETHLEVNTPTDRKKHAARKHKEQHLENQLGEQEGRAESSKVLGGKEFPGLESIVRTAKKQLDELPPAGREAYTHLIEQMVKTLEREGRLPHESLKRVLDALTPLLRGLPKLGGDTARELAMSLNLDSLQSQMQHSTEAITKRWGAEYKLLPVTSHMTMAEVIATTEGDMGNLKQIMEHGTGRARERAAHEFSLLKGQLGHYLDEAKATVGGKLEEIADHSGPLSHKSLDAILKVWGKLPHGLQVELEAAGGKVHDGLDKILGEAHKDLVLLGVTGAVSAGGAGSGTNPTSGVSGGAAQGMLVQLGKPGAAGHDSIPMSVGSANIVAAPGEQVAVFTRHQQQVANTMLAPIGGLPGLFNKVSKPHYMASGGFVPSEAFAGLTRGRIDQGVDFSGSGPVRAVADGSVRSVGLWPGWPGTGGVVYDTPRGPVYVMEDFAPSVKAGQKLSAGQVIGRATGGSSGIEAGWANSSGTAPEIRYGGLPDGTPMPGGKSFAAMLGGGAGGGAQAAVWKKLLEPKLHMPGEIGQIAQAIMHSVTAAANRYGQKKLDEQGTTPSTGGGSHSANETLGKTMMLAAGWPAGEWPSLQALWTQESGWDANSVNKSSGAYGIPQALGHGHPFALGDARAQIAWGLKYIKERYGSPAGAEAHERAYNWYEQGGIIHAAGGLEPTAVTAAHKPPKQKSSTPRRTPAGHLPNKGIDRLVHELGRVPDTENVKALQPYTPLLEELADQQTLLSKMEGIPNREIVTDAGLAQIKPFLGGLPIGKGTPIVQAQALAAKANNTQLGEWLTYLGEQPSSKVLTPADIAALKPHNTAGFMNQQPVLANVTPMYVEGENLILQTLQINQAEAMAEGRVQSTWEALAAKYRERQEQAKAHARAELRRYENIKSHLAKLATGSLQQKVASAQSTYARQELEYDARVSKEALMENLAGEQALPKKSRNEKLIGELKAQDHHLQGYITALHKPVNKTGAALVALRKHELTDELSPIEQNLSNLGGSRTSVGTGGDIGRLVKDMNTVNKGVTTIGAEIRTERNSTIPGLKIEYETIKQENENAGLKPTPTGTSGETQQQSQLLALAEQELHQAGELLATQGAQLRAITSFTNIPHFEKGGPVLQDGLIYAHRGEHVVPKEGTLVQKVDASPAVVNVENHVHGDIAPLIALIDSRVQHPRNVQGVSQQIARRTDMIAFGAR